MEAEEQRKDALFWQKMAESKISEVVRLNREIKRLKAIITALESLRRARESAAKRKARPFLRDES